MKSLALAALAPNLGIGNVHFTHLEWQLDMVCAGMTVGPGQLLFYICQGLLIAVEMFQTTQRRENVLR